MTIKSIIAGMFLIAFAFTSQAQTNTQNIKQTQINQKQRIKQGVKSGELTKAETAQLVKQQRKVKQSKRRAKADGVVTKRERANIRRKQANASKNIAIKKHNKRDRN